MAFLGLLLVVGFAIFPAAVLTGFIISHFRRRLGWRLAMLALALGLAAIILVLLPHALLGSPHGLFPPGMVQVAARAFLDAALPEEGAKLFLLYFVVRRHKDCDSGGDLFSSAMLISLGFAAVENIFYVLGGGDAWLSIGMMRSVLSVPGHAIFGCMMGFFAARAFRGRRPSLNWLLALLMPFLAHGFYDFPLMAWMDLGATSIQPLDRNAIWMFWLLLGTLITSGLAAIVFCRRELVEIFAGDGRDQDVHLPRHWAVRPWRWFGNLMIVASALAMALGLLLLAFDRLEGAFLLLPSIFPQTFGWIMRLRPPPTSDVAARARIAER